MNNSVINTAKALEKNGYQVSVFSTAKKAAEYLNRQIDGVTVGMGGSMTLENMGLFDTLGEHNEVYWHWHSDEGVSPVETSKKAADTDVYLTSVNAISETGELVNIDGTGNRLSSTLYGHRKVYFVAGANKIAYDLSGAIDRARNIAAPQNAKRLGRLTPCVKGGKCYDCDSPERICGAMVIHFKKMGSCDMEVVLIEEGLGY